MSSSRKASKSMIEGGNFKCFIHNFETDDPIKWDKHCIETKHKISGTAPCVFCGKSVEFKDLPYIGMGKPVGAVCDNCKKEYVK